MPSPARLFPGDQTMISLQYLRAVAALMVVYFHMHWGANYVYELGALGVDIFFVISGFIMWHTTAGRSISPLDFLKRRLLRVIPLYWIATITMFVMPAVSGTIAGGTKSDFPHLLSSLLFVPWPSPVSPKEYLPVYVPGWSINYEMFFYLIFGLWLAMGSRTVRLIGLAGVLIAPVALGLLLSPSGRLGFYASPLLLEFLIGVLVAAWLPRGLNVQSGVAIGIIAVGAVGLIAAAGDRALLGALGKGTAAGLIVLGLVSWERRGTLPKSAFLLSLGDASYAIYLTHLFSLGAVGVIWTRLSLSEMSAAYWLLPFIAMAASVVGGVWAHRYIENPLRGIPLPSSVFPLRSR
jgi:exopolysaccharide production protein ExoZ